MVDFFKGVRCLRCDTGTMGVRVIHDFFFRLDEQLVPYVPETVEGRVVSSGVVLDAVEVLQCENCSCIEMAFEQKVAMTRKMGIDPDEEDIEKLSR